jgi:diadenosine tetraphosphate (Ap4A) HIT family hydrolase
MNCPFCQELSTGMLPAEFDLAIDSRIIAETEHFVVIADISPLSPGHLLIIPRAHLLSFGAVPEKNREELSALVAKVRNILSKCYSPPVIMEHGSSASSDGGACISHAHLQVFPGAIDMRKPLSCFRVARIVSFWELAAWSQRGEPYVFFQNQRDEMFVADHIEDIQKQFIRIEIAKRIGVPDSQWDWRKNIFYENLYETVPTLQKAWRESECQPLR